MDKQPEANERTVLRDVSYIECEVGVQVLEGTWKSNEVIDPCSGPQHVLECVSKPSRDTHSEECQKTGGQQRTHLHQGPTVPLHLNVPNYSHSLKYPLKYAWIVAWENREILKTPSSCN